MKIGTLKIVSMVFICVTSLLLALYFQWDKEGLFKCLSLLTFRCHPLHVTLVNFKVVLLRRPKDINVPRTTQLPMAKLFRTQITQVSFPLTFLLLRRFETALESVWGLLFLKRSNLGLTNFWFSQLLPPGGGTVVSQDLRPLEAMSCSSCSYFTSCPGAVLFLKNGKNN